MSVELIAFIVLVITTFVNLGVQLYIHYEAYPLFRFVGRPEFGAYLNEYERRLIIPLVVPYFLTLLSNIVLLFTRPAPIPVGWVIVALVLNLAVSGTTVLLATPIYNRIKQAGEASADEMGRLMSINLIRLILSVLSGLVIVYLLFVMMS